MRIKGGANMTESLYTNDQFDRLVEIVIDLESKVLQLESDVYDMQRDNAEMNRRLSDLESSKRIPPF